MSPSGLGDHAAGEAGAGTPGRARHDIAGDQEHVRNGYGRRVPLLLVALEPLEAVTASSGLTGSSPLYSSTRTSGYTAAVLKCTVTMLPSAAAASATFGGKIDGLAGSTGAHRRAHSQAIDVARRIGDGGDVRRGVVPADDDYVEVAGALRSGKAHRDDRLRRRRYRVIVLHEI